MAYQAKRRKTYEEDFQLVDEHGKIVHEIKVSLDADSMATKLSEKYIALTKALKELQNVENSMDKMEVLGSTVIDILEAVFGKEDASVILKFYDNKYIELCKEVMPFITTTVIPQVRKIAQENKKQILSKYNRRQRRLLGRR